MEYKSPKGGVHWFIYMTFTTETAGIMFIYNIYLEAK